MDDEEIPTYINDMPNEIIFQILDELKDGNDIRSASLVCKRWFHVVDELVGHQVYIGDGYLQPPELKHSDPSILSSLVIRELHLSGVSLNVDEVGDIYRPHTTKIVHLAGFVNVCILDMVHRFTNLTTLDIHVSTLGMISNESLLAMEWPTIKNLILSGHEPCVPESTYSLTTVDSVISVARFLGVSMFPNMETFLWTVPLLHYMDKFIMEVLVRFFENHRHTLKVLNMRPWIPVKSYKRVSEKAKDRAHFFFVDNQQSSISHCEDHKFALKKIDYVCDNERSFWMELGPKQLFGMLCYPQPLTSFRFHANELYGLTYCLRNLNDVTKTTLRTVDLKLDADVNSPIDLGVFRSCVNLKELSVVAGTKSRLLSIGPVPRGKRENLINVHFIPRKLRILKISGFFMNSFQVDRLAYRNHLKILHLDHIAPWNGYGMTVTALLKLSETDVQIELIKSINIYGFRDRQTLATLLKGSPCSKIGGHWVQKLFNFLQPTLEKTPPSSAGNGMSSASTESGNNKPTNRKSYMRTEDLIEKFLCDCAA